MRKTIQTKLIHLLGGYTRNEYILQGHTYFINGKLAKTIELRNLMKKINGVSKQECIDIIYNEVCPQPKNN